MNEGLIPRRYAKALYKVAVERKAETRMYELMLHLVAAFAVTPDLKKIVANPFVGSADKSATIKAAANATKNDTTFSEFIDLLIQNRRIDLFFEIANAYIDLYRKENNIRRVQVISAAPLAPEVEKRIKKLIEDHLKGAKMEFSSKIDPDVIGGFIITIDNERLDASMKNRINEIRLNLINK